jgi:hypothetical protein
MMNYHLYKKITEGILEGDEVKARELLKKRADKEKYKHNSESYHYRVEQFVHSMLDGKVSPSKWEAPAQKFREETLARDLKQGGWKVCNKR